MKNKLLFLVPVLFAAVSCTNTNENTGQKNAVQTRTISLTGEEFLKKVLNYQADSLEWKYLGDKPAIVDFYANWCNPCKLIAPTLESLAHEYDGRIYIYKIDVDKERELAAGFGIKFLPALLFIPMEGEATVSYGVMTNAAFKKQIDSLLLNN